MTVPVINPGDKYMHFKGNAYEIVCIAKNHEAGEDDIVVYKAIITGIIYARPLAMFCDPVDKVKYPNIIQDMRFERIYN